MSGKSRHANVKVTCNQCGSTWNEPDGVAQMVRCPLCHKCDVTMEVVRS